MRKKKIKELIVAWLMLIVMLQPMGTYAADARNYNLKNIDYNDYYSEYHEAGYMNECTLVDITPSITYIDSAQNSVSSTTVGETVYVPSETRVNVRWNMNGKAAFACKNLDIWQHAKDSDFKHVGDYNFGRTGPYGLRGKASKLVGEMITSKTGNRWTQTYSIEEFNSIKFLCTSPQYEGGDGDSAAVGNVMDNVTEFYVFSDKPTIKEDNNPPTVAVNLSKDAVNGWYPTGTKATFTASDEDSGVASLIVAGQGRTNPFTMDLANGNNSITYSATDNAGKSSGENTLTANVDGTAPTLKADISADEAIPGWYKDDVKVTLSATDDESGIKTFKVNDTDYTSGSASELTDGENTFKLNAEDNVGNTANEVNVKYYVDKSNPTASITGGTTTWTNQDVKLTINGKDNQSGLTAMVVQYSSDNTNWSTYDTKTYEATTDAKSETVMASKNGSYRLLTTDAVGHVATSSETIYITQIDKEKPTIVATVTGDEGAPFDKWYKKSAKIKIVATEHGVSGLKQIIYNGVSTTLNSIILPTTTEDVNKFNYSAEDNAGNSTGAFQTDIYVDASAPTNLNWTNNQSTKWTNQDITVTMQAKDIYSGLKKFVVQKQNETTKEWGDYTEVSAAYETTLTSKTALIHENGTYRFKAIDRVGYEAINPNTIEIKMIDKEKPTVTPTEIGTVSANGWYKNTVTLKLLAKDFGVSGLKTLYVKIGLTSTQSDMEDNRTMTYTRTEVVDDEGSTTATYRASDWAGNVSNTGTSVLKVDKTTPKDVTVYADTSIWTNSSVKVTANATDIMSGLDKVIIQKYETNKWVDYLTNEFNGESAMQTTTFDIEENGIYRIKAVDMVGFEMTSDVSMGGSEINKPKVDDPKPGIIIIDKIDKIKPLIEATIIGGDSYKDTSGGWYKDDVRLKLNATDEASGVGTITCNGAVSTNETKSKTYEEQYPPFQNGINHFEYFATDVAGNHSETGTTDLKIDMTNPETASLKKLTTGWVNSTTGVTLECLGQDMESGLLQFILERSDNGTDGWAEGTKYTYLGETTLETVNMIVTQNGYYRLAVYDRVQNLSYASDVIHVDNIDDTIPVGSSLGITPDTEEWVNEKTGVDLTATGQDMESGINSLSVMGLNESNDFVDISIQDFAGETSLLSTDYLTHLNGVYKASATDKVGNYREMKDEEALDVPNIDPVDPYLVVDVDSTKWATLENGYEIYAYAKDSESGLNSIKLQMLDENSEWQDTMIDFEKQSYVKDEEKLSTYEGNFAQNSLNKVVLAVNKQFFSNDTTQANDKAVSGNNEMVKVVFKVRKNGTYRVVTDDIVTNTTNSDSVVVTTVDFDSPTIMVEGNPTEWTNQTATIKVTAMDASSGIAKMTLNGKEVEFETVNKASFFTFDAEKNETFQVAAYDKAGHSVLQDVDVTKIDKESPYVDSQFGDWVNGESDTKVTIGDALSGVRSAYINEVMIDVPDGYQTIMDTKLKAEVTYVVTITDNAGNRFEQQLTPSLTVEGNPTEWTNQTATIKVTAKDITSDITKMTLNGKEVSFDTGNKQSFFTFEAEKNETFQVAAYDKQGHGVQQVVNVTKIDKESPYVDSQFGDWVNGVSDAKVTVGDALSGVKSASINEVIINVPDGYKTTMDTKLKAEVTYVVTITDNAGNCFEQQLTPSLTVEGNPTKWTNQTATIKVTAKNITSDITKMTLNGKEVSFKTGNKQFYFTFDAEKNETFQVAVYDKAGNSVQQVVDVTKIDKESPYVDSTLSEWVEGVSDATVTVGDALSGVKSATINDVKIEVPDGHQATMDTKIHADVTYLVTITDNAGNQLTKQVSENKVLDHIKVTTPPDKTKYKVKENFDKKGMVVTAYYTDKSKAVVTDYQIANAEKLAVKQKKIDVSYTERGITKTDDTGISVSTESTPDPTPAPVPDKPVTPTPVKPTPVTPKPTPETPTPEEEVVVATEEPEVTKETPKKEKVLEIEPETAVKEKREIPVMAVVGSVAGTSMFLIFLFMMFTNVKVYSMKENGNYKFIGRTRARKKEEFYYVKTNPIMVMCASSGDFKFVFSKGFVKTHKDINVIVKIEKREFNRHLAEGEDTIYVEYDA